MDLERRCEEPLKPRSSRKMQETRDGKRCGHSLKFSG
jgi:hypothetical protein